MEALMERNREKVEVKELTSEITPILKDFFVADIRQEGNTIRMQFKDGQQFYLTVREI